MSDPFAVRGQRVIVTGGAMGIGSGIAELFAGRGLDVLVNNAGTADVTGSLLVVDGGRLLA
jgi:NAD(P)-dependent dehydrogenase (short-subunit alcohol dehydrogenase family)